MSSDAALERELALPAEPRSARDARAFVSDLLRSAGAQRWEESAALAVSEIVTNAVLHAHTDVTVRARVEAGSLRVEVWDGNASLPSLRLYDQQATTGRGMALVAAITSTHGITSLGAEGKVVWFTVDDAPPEPSEDDLLAAWGDVSDEPVQDQPGALTTTLVALPVTLWLAARQHHDALLRELALSRAGAGQPSSDLAQADRARTAVSAALDRAIADATENDRASPLLPAGHPTPLPEVPAVVDLQVAVPDGGADDFAALQDVLDEAEQGACSEALLVRPGLPEIIAVRDWACDQVIAQAGGTAASAWPGTDAERFAQSVADDTTGLLWDPTAVREADEGVVAADDANRIVAISRPLAAELGWDVEDLIGRRVVALVPHRFREAHVAGFTRHLTTGQSHVLGVPLELPVLRRDGSEVLCSFLIEATGTAPGRTVYLARIAPLERS